MRVSARCWPEAPGGFLSSKFVFVLTIRGFKAIIRFPRWPWVHIQSVPICRCCGKSENIISYPDDFSLAICPDCCAASEAGHDFIYSQFEEHYCDHCGVPRWATDWRDD